MNKPANRSGKVADTAPAEEKVLPEPKVKAEPVKEEKYYPKMGDVVIFNYRNPSAPSAISMPLVVTKVHADGQILDGVALNTNNTAGSMGAICAHGIYPGNGEFEWRVK